MNEERPWIPEICYEEVEDGLTSHIPFIEVPDDAEMPKVLFIFESSNTGETEPGLDGEEIPIIELNLHQYANMNTLRDQLPTSVYDTIRQALGLEPLLTAVEGGKKITENVRNKLNLTE
jgi:hypothetical protein